MKTEHTPGPWKTDSFGQRIIAHYPSKGGIEKVERENATHLRTVEICNVETNLGSNILTDEQKANVRLIKASPILLDAAIEAVDELEIFEASLIGIDGHTKKIILKLKDAISQATK